VPRAPRFIAFALAFGFALDARAYVRGVTQNEQSPLFWPSNCALVTVYTNGYAGLGRDEIAKSVAAAAQAWGPSVSCPSGGPPSFEIVVAMAPDGAKGAAAKDLNNVVVFTEAGWPYQADALALTTHYADHAGRIIGTDIEINPNVTWANLDPGAPPESHGIERFDLQTVMTHEFGHFVGLAHTCFSGSAGGSDSETEIPASLVDDSGAPIPRCTDPPDATNATAAESVMWFVVDPESTTKRVLTADDVKAVCDVYPPGTGASCPLNLPDDGCGCSAAHPRGPEAPALFCSALILWRTRRRR
jgi:hypothetical protein